MTRLVILLLVAATVPARADDEWAHGVSADRQSQATALFAEANNLFARQAHGPALDKYKAAIAIWDQGGLHSSRYSEADGWSAPLTIGPKPMDLHYARSPRLVVKPDGRAAAVWMDFGQIWGAFYE